MPTTQNAVAESLLVVSDWLPGRLLLIRRYFRSLSAKLDKGEQS
jgi:hypothetical protein